MKFVFTLLFLSFVFISFGQNNPLRLSEEQRTQLSAQDVHNIDSTAHFLETDSRDSTLYYNYYILSLSLDSRDFKDMLNLWLLNDVDGKIAKQNTKEDSLVYLGYKATLLNNQGVGLVYGGNMETGLESLYQSLEITESIGDSAKMAKAYFNFGALFYNNNDFENAETYWIKALKIQKEKKNWPEASKLLTYLAAIANKHNDFEQAKIYLNESEEYAALTNDKITLSIINERLGDAERLSKNYAKSIEYYEISLGYILELNETIRVAKIHNSIALTYNEAGNYAKALAHAKIAYKIAEEEDYLRGMSTALKLMHKAEVNKGNYKKALEYYEQFRNINDTIFNSKNSKLLIQKEANYKIEQQAFRDSIKNANAIQVKNVELNLEKEKSSSRTMQLWFSLFFLALVAISGVIIFKRYRIAKEQKTQLDQTNKKLNDLHDSRSRFFANLSHEFRTPLTVIESATEKIKNAVEGTLAKDVEMISRNNSQLFNLVNQILDLKKLESGQMTVSMVQSDLARFTKFLFDSVDSLSKSKKIETHFSGSQAELLADFDPEKVNRIFYNLFSNAIKYTSENGKVDISVSENNNQIFLIFKDNGIGISEEELPNIFDQFYQVDDSTTRKEGGTGIGLALVKELVELLKGSISVESEIGKGSVFTVAFPKTNKAVIVAVESLFMQTIKAEKQEVGVVEDKLEDDDKPLLLVVEDHLDLQQVLKDKLEKHYRLAFANDGKMGYKQATELTPDLILSDVMMPKMSGFELCEALRKNEKTSHIPIILLTARADEDSKIEGLKYGADAYLTKPFNTEELQLQLKNAFAVTQRLQSRFTQNKNPFLQPDPRAKLEDTFIKKLKEVFAENLDRENFGPEEICEIMGFSRSQLHRKVKSLTGFSASIYLRNYRLEQAQKIIKSQPGIRISEVAYATGFNTAQYFSAKYKGYFGKTPKEDA